MRSVQLACRDRQLHPTYEIYHKSPQLQQITPLLKDGYSNMRTTET